MENGRTYEKMKIEKIKLCQRASMRFGEIASGAEYRIDEQFKNLPTFGVSIIFKIEKNSENLSIFQVVKF